MSTELVQMKVSKEVKAALKEQAAADNRSVSNYISTLVLREQGKLGYQQETLICR